MKEQQDTTKLLRRKGLCPKPDTPRFQLGHSSLSEELDTAIEETLTMVLNDGIAKSSVRQMKYYLRILAQNTDIFNPEEVKHYIATHTIPKTGKPYSDETKNKLAYAVDKFYEKHSIIWKKPFYKVNERIPLIPSPNDVNSIISNSSPKYATIFTLLTEIGCNPMELTKTEQRDIDLQQGIITIKGAKGHSGGTYKLKDKTTEMLSIYLQKYGLPFPQSSVMSQVWRDTRQRTATKLCRPELNNIPLKNLRNYSGAQLYEKLGRTDVIEIMRHLRHKKLETTMHYIRGLPRYTSKEYLIATVQLGQPDTIQKIQELLLDGFKLETTADNYQFYRKLKGT